MAKKLKVIRRGIPVLAPTADNVHVVSFVLGFCFVDGVVYLDRASLAFGTSPQHVQ